MKRRILLAVSLAVACVTASDPLVAHNDGSARPTASEKCLVTDATYVAGHKVLDPGRYCVPWI